MAGFNLGESSFNSVTTPTAQYDIVGQYRQEVQKEQGLLSGESLLHSPILIPAGAIDTIGQSIGLIEQGTVERTLGHISENMANLYGENEQGYRLIGDVGASFVGGGLAMKAIQTGSRGYNAFRLLGLGGTRIEAILGANAPRVRKMERVFGKMAEVAGRDGIRDLASMPAATRNLHRAARLRNLENNLKAGVAGEAFIYAFQNESELFFPEGSSFNDAFLWSGAGIVGGAGIGHLIQTPALRRSLQRAGKAADALQEASTGHYGPNIVGARMTTSRVAQGPRSASVADDPKTVGVYQQQATEARVLIRESTEGLAQTNLIPGVSKPFNPTQAVVNEMSEHAATNPRIVAHTESIEPASVFTNWDKTKKQVLDGHQTRLDELEAERAAAPAGSAQAFDIDEKIAAEMARVNQVQDYMPVLSDRVGNLSSGDTRGMSVYAMPAAPIVRTEHKGQTVVFAQRDQGRRVGIAADGRVYLGKNRVMRPSAASGLTVFERTKVYEAMPEALRIARNQLADQNFIPKKRMQINRNSDAMQLDYALALLRNNNNDFDAVKKLVDLSDFDSISDLRHASYDAKYQLFRNQRIAEQKLLSQYPGGNAPFFEKGVFTSQDYSNFLNMRMSNDIGDASPAMEWFESMYLEGVTSLKNTAGLDTYENMMKRFTVNFAADMPLTTVQGMIKEGADVNELSRLLELDAIGKLSGREKLDAFTMLVRKPKITAQDASIRLYDHQQVAAVFEQDRLATFVDELANSTNPVLARLGELYNQGEFAPLIEAIQRGTRTLTEGVNDEPAIRQLGALGIKTVQTRMRHVPGAEQMQMLSDMVQRVSKRTITDDLRRNTVSLAKLQKPTNRVSAQLYRNYDSAMQQGWRLADDAIPADGLFPLSAAKKDVRWNEGIAKQMGLDDVPTHLPDPVLRDGTPLQLDTLALDGLAEMRRYSAMLYEGNHITSRAMGHSGVALRHGHNIVPDRGTQEMAFVTDAHGRVKDFALGVNTADAKNQADKLARQHQAQATAAGESNLFGVTTKEDVERYYELKRQAFNSAQIDVSDAFALTGGRTQEGARRGIESSDNWIKWQLETVQRQLERQSNKVTAAYFKPQLEQMHYMQQAAKVANQGIGGKQAFEDVFDMASGLLLNTNRTNPGSLYATLDGWASAPLEMALEKVYEVTGRLDRSPQSRATMMSIGKELSEKYGYDPVAYGAKLAANQLPGEPPPNLKQLIRMSSAFTQSVALRWMEIAHPVLTAASIYTTTPHAIAYMARGKNETREAYRLRVGVAADLLDDGDIAVPNATKLVSLAIAKYLRGDYKDVLEEATRLGYTQAPVGEFVEALQSVGAGRTTRALQKINNSLGVLTDKSEEFARSISMLTAYELYHGVGGQGKHISLAAANDLANKTIADYRGTNRAQVFRGTLGAPLALFQTFGINYFERLYRGIENKQWRAVMTQGSSQAFVFGGTALPGYDIVNDQLLSTWNFDHTPEDNVREVFSKPVGDVLLHGTLGNIPKLLGADDGMAISTRGAAQLPFPITPLGIADAPFPSMVRRSYGVMSQAMKSMRQNPGIGSQQLREALILATPNRPIRGIMEIAQGYSTNANGDIIEDDTRRLMSVVSRIAGLRTTSEAEKARILHLDRIGQMAERERQRSLRRAVIGTMRSSDGLRNNELPEVFESYVANGGSADGFLRWLKESALKAHYSKFDRRTREVMNSSERGREFLRFYDALD